MLRELKVSDYAIIDKLCVGFAPGLNVLTGETGAGKSIIVGALSFALGEKVSDEVIRKGEAACRVEAAFDLGRTALRADLKSDAVDGAGLTMLSREVGRDGRSRCCVNGKSISLTSFRELGNLLVDFHGQHEHQMILNVGSHIDFLDDYGNLSADRGLVGAGRKAFIEAGRRIKALRQQAEDVESKRDFIGHEINEIESMNLHDNEDAEIEGEMGLMENAEKIMAAGSEASQALYDGDEAAIKLIARARTALERIASYSRGLAELGENLDQAHAIVKEVAESLRDSVGRIDLDSSRLEYLRDRAAGIERMKRKYGKSVGEVLERLRQLRASLEGRAELEAEIRDLEQAQDRLAGELVTRANGLSKKRKTVAARLEKAVESEIGSLGIEGGAFKIVFERVEDGEEISSGGGAGPVIGEKGIDEVEFFIRTNKGEDLLPLRRIASGGEISRVMLALKRVLADVDTVGTLVFDEIDSGIGGGIADVVAAKLREVGRSRQVICITHLPQIAAAAELHLAVGKGTQKGRTVTNVAEVRGKDRVTELARMLAGAKPPQSAMVHAEEMLRRSGSL
jgi:DNA repair protein RecN (Recombination protein N)